MINYMTSIMKLCCNTSNTVSLLVIIKYSFYLVNDFFIFTINI